MVEKEALKEDRCINRIMGTAVRSLGSRFEARGDYAQARVAYQTAGLDKEAVRMGTILETLELAGRLARVYLHGRAVDILLERDLVKVAENMARALEKADTPASNYLKARVLAHTGRIGEIEPVAERLYAFGPYGVYLLACAVLEAAPENARAMADFLCGKPAPSASIHEPEPADASGHAEEEEAFLLFGDEKQAKAGARAMASSIRWSMINEEEMLFYSLQIYRRLGDMEEAGRCLEALREQGSASGAPYYFYGLLSLEGIEGLQGKGLLDKDMNRLVAAIAWGKTDNAIRAVENGWIKGDPGQRAQQRYDVYWHLLEIFDQYMPERISATDLLKLADGGEVAGKELAAAERAKLAGIDTMIASGRFEAIQEANKRLRDVRFHLLDGQRAGPRSFDYSIRCADAAFQLQDNAAALEFAGEIYLYPNIARALDCADGLLRLGATQKAKRLYRQCASRSKNQAQDKGAGTRLLKTAAELETEHPLISMAVYAELGPVHTDQIKRIAGRMVGSGSLDEVGQAAWMVSYVDKRSMEMKRLLERLGTFGEEGARTARAIREEMKVPRLFSA